MSHRSQAKRKKRRRKRRIKGTKTVIIANKIKKKRERSKKNPRNQSNRQAGSIDLKVRINQRNQRSRSMMKNLRIKIRHYPRRAPMHSKWINRDKARMVTSNLLTNRSTQTKKKLSEVDLIMAAKLLEEIMSVPMPWQRRKMMANMLPI